MSDDVDADLLEDTPTPAPAADAGAVPVPDVVKALAATDVQALVQAAVAKEVQARIAKAAAVGVEQVMTADFLDRVTADAATVAEGEVIRVLAGADDPESEPVPEESAATEEEPENYFPNVHVFVRDFLAHVYARDVGQQITGFRWCPQWAEHAEAYCRLESMWKAFEALRRDPGAGASVWWRDHADPAMNALTGSDGPFRGCSDTTHVLLPSLPTQEPPEALARLGGS